jgi:hypothetical protein
VRHWLGAWLLDALALNGAALANWVRCIPPSAALARVDVV